MKRICALIAMLAAATQAAANDVATTGTNTDEPTIVILRNRSDLSGSKLVLDASSYVGYTESFANTFAEFLTNIQAFADPNAIAGIDSQSGASTRTISDPINLSTLNGAPQDTPYYIGTTSRVTITGPITPTRTPDGAQDTLYLTALNGGYLNINTRLGTATSPVDAVVIGQPATIRPTDGTIELSGSNSYTGGTRILGGTLQVNAGNNLGAGVVTVSSGATLNLGASGTIAPGVSLEAGSTISGHGTFTQLVTIGPGVQLIPGAIGKIAELQFHGGIILQSGAIWHIDLATAASDKIRVWDNLAIQGSPFAPITISLYSVNNAGNEGPLASFNPAQSHTWTIAHGQNNQPLVITDFDPAFFEINAEAFFKQNPSLRGLGDFSIGQIDNTLSITFTPVPEPGTYALMAIGLTALAIINHRRRRHT